MTPRAKKYFINISAIVSALLAISAYAIRNVPAAVDARYVHSAAYERDRLADSLNYRSDVKEIRALIVHLDSDIHVPRRPR